MKREESNLANVEKLLHGAPGNVDLLSQLEPTDAEDKLLKSAKTRIRDQLRKVIREAAKKRLGVTIEPRFFTQGSGAYKLLNRRAWMPPQRMDLDDGVYLPMTFVKGERPSVAAAIFFEIVDAALRELVERENWDGFEEKDACARVLVTGNIHVDVPLYAIPDVEFGRLAKMAMDRALMAENDIDFMQSRKLKVDSWEEVPSDKVLLAHRRDDWKPSDPRKIHEWFLAAVDFYGELLRRECRYLKAWRDYHKLDFISSLILMVYAWTVFEEVGHLNLPRRDDLMLLNIAERLPDLFAQAIKNPAEPAEPGEMLGENWTYQERRAGIQAAAKMHEELDMAINNCYIADVAVQRMHAVFGNRIPNRPDLVGVHRAAAAAVAAAPAVIVPAPAVGRSTSG
jgi:hypothetical protein